MLATIATVLFLTTAAAPTELAFFEGSFANSFGEAREQDKLVAVYFWRNGSDHCASMWQHTLNNATVVRALNSSSVLYSANYDDDAGGKLFKRFNVSTLPSIVFLTADGKPEDAVNGFIDHDGLLGELERIQRGEGTVSGLRKAAAEAKRGSEDAIELTWKLAGKVHDLGLIDEHDAVLASLREMDPKGKTVIGARAHLWHVRDSLWKGMTCSCEAECEEGSCDGPEKAALVDIGPIYKHAKRVKLPEARFEAWNAVANLENYRNNADLACKAYERAAKHVPAKNAVSWPKDVAWSTIQRAEKRDLSEREKKLALSMAELCVKKAKILDPASESYVEAYGDYDPRSIQAEALATLAFAYDLNGQDKKALKTAHDVLSLNEEFKEALEPILKRAES